MTSGVITIAIVFSCLLFFLALAVVSRLVYSHFQRQKRLEGGKENIADEEAMVQSISQKRRESVTAATSLTRKPSVASNHNTLARSDSVTSVGGVIVPVTRQISANGRRASIGSITAVVPASPASVHSHSQTTSHRQSVAAPSEQSHRASIAEPPAPAPTKRQSVAAAPASGSVNRRHSKAPSHHEVVPAAVPPAQSLSTNAAAALGNGAGAGLKIASINSAKATRQEERRQAKIEREKRRRKRQESHVKVKDQTKKQSAPKEEDDVSKVQKELEYYTLKGPTRKLRSISSLASSARRRRKNKTRGPVIMEDDEMSTKTGKGLGLVEVTYNKEVNSEADFSDHKMVV